MNLLPSTRGNAMFPIHRNNAFFRPKRRLLSPVPLLDPHQRGIATRLGACLIVTLAMALSSHHADACACGCGIFDVATSSKFPLGAGGVVYLEGNYQNQNRNWSGDSSAPAADNDDKRIRTDAITAGVQYFFNPAWGVQLDVPYLDRRFEKIGGASGNDPVDLSWSGIGDIRIKGIYTGFFPDMSTGVSFGLKLPSGSFTHNDAYDDVDRDSQIGTGSTDILLGVFHHDTVPGNKLWSWFTQAEADVPVFIQDNYRPGVEINVALGAYYEGWTVGGVRIKPVGQVIASIRGHDSGSASADPVASGYQRILLSAGAEFQKGPVGMYLDAELPVYQHVTGDQLVSEVLFKAMVSYRF